MNPDFSQVDVDQQVINLNRYELFFPEKRQFFLENGDLFSNFGYSDIRPFFSRRIGLNQPIDFGARMTGKLDKDWRIGAMDIQTGTSDDNNLNAANYGMITLQRRAPLSAPIITTVMWGWSLTWHLPAMCGRVNYWA